VYMLVVWQAVTKPLRDGNGWFFFFVLELKIIENVMYEVHDRLYATP